MSNRSTILIGGYSGYGTPYMHALGSDYDYVVVNSPADVAAQNMSEVFAVVFTGGADIDPAVYGHEADPSTWCDAGHDAVDDALLAAIDEHETMAVPETHATHMSSIFKLGTCRGMQRLFCHYLGGTLFQDIPHHACSEHTAYVVPQHGLRRYNSEENVVEFQGRQYHNDASSASQITINSIHHQACNWNSIDSSANSPTNRSHIRATGHQDYRLRTPRMLLVGEAEGQTSVEAFSHWPSMTLAFQYHPEWLDTDTDGYRYSIDAIRAFVLDTQEHGWQFPYNGAS